MIFPTSPDKISRQVIPDGSLRTLVTYKDAAYLKNPVFPAELYEYRRGKNMKLSIDGETKSLFAKPCQKYL